MTINYIRMNGLGNDFLIYDGRKTPKSFALEEVIQLSSRNNRQTKGCDQFIIIENSKKADVRMLVYNSDGSEVFACGNASRCVVQILADEGKKDKIKIETKAAILEGKIAGEYMVSVDMGAPIFDWKKIPLAKDVDVKNLPISANGFEKPFAVSMGNPHMVFTTIEDVGKIDVIGIGKPLEYHTLFPERANVGFAQIMDEKNINLRVFERGAGETLACGTGACAAAVAAISRKLCRSPINIHTRGGDMVIEWNGKETDHVIMTGPVEHEGLVKA